MSFIKKNMVIKKAVISIVLPVMITLVIVASLNLYNFKKHSSFSSKAKNKEILTEILSAVEFQDMALGMVEGEIAARFSGISNKIVNEIYPDCKDIEKLDLAKVRVELGMDPENEDIYFIDKSGLVVNTTFENDRNLNIFDFGEKHKKVLMKLFSQNKFTSERFTIEATTKRLRKYCYQPTKDGKYLVEIGIYSKPADETINYMKKRMTEFSSGSNGIISVDFIIACDRPFPLNRDINLDKENLACVLKTVSTRRKQTLNVNDDNKVLNYEFSYFPVKNSRLYKDAVIRIISNRSEDVKLFKYLMYSLVIFGSVFILSMLFFFVLIKRQKKEN